MKIKERMICYLQMRMDDYRKEAADYGEDDMIVKKKMDALIACKQMVEAVIQEPVNLQKDGKVTVGF